MAGAVVLRVIEGGAAEPRVAFASAPDLPGVLSVDRIPPPPNRWSTFRIATAAVISVAFHAGLIAWGMQHEPEQEARAAGGSSDTIVTEGISVVLLDSLPSDASDGGEALPEAKQVVAATSARLAAPAEAARPVEAEAKAARDDVSPAPVASAAVPQAVTDDAIAPVPEPVAPAVSSSAAAPVAEAAANVTATAAAAAATESTAAAAVADTAPEVAAEASVAAVHADDAAVSSMGETTIAPDVTRNAARVEGDRMIAAAGDQSATAVADITPKTAPTDAPAARSVEDDVSPPMPATPVVTQDDAVSRPIADAPAAKAQTEDARPVDDAAAPQARETTVAAATAVAEPAAETTRPVETTKAPVAETKIATASPVEEPPPTPKPVTAKPKPVPAPPSEQRAASVADTAARDPVPGKAGAGGASSEERGAASTSGYQAKLAAHLRRFRSFPEEARKRGISGIATVRFTVNAAGAVTSASLAKSSGAGVLDAAAVAMVHRASPFPPIPPNLGVGVMTVNVPVRFDLR